MKYLLDTCVISELISKQPSKKVVDWVESQNERTFCLSVLTLGELQKGISKLPAGKKRIRMKSWVDNELLKRFTGRIIDVNRDVAMRWGDLSGAAEKEGRKIPVLDGLLAATSIQHGLTFVTRNIKHIRDTGAELYDPWAY